MDNSNRWRARALGVIGLAILVSCAAHEFAALPGAAAAPTKDAVQPELFAAAANGDLEALRLLVAAGADIGRRDARGWSALHHAAGANLVDTVGFLLAHGAAVDTQNEEGATALHFAGQEGYLAVARALLERGASTKVRTKTGLTPLDLALVTEHDEVASLLIERDR